MSNSARLKFLNELGAGVKPVDYILEADNWSAQDVLTAAKEFGVHHIIQVHHRFAEVERRATEFMIQHPGQIFLCPWSPWSPGLDGKCQDLLKLPILANSRKQDHLAQAEAFMRSQKRLRHSRSSVLLLLDELFVNVKKASTKKIGVLGYTFIAVQQNFLLIGSFDSLGLLHPDQMLGNALSCYQRGVAKSIQQEGRGAGIGSYFMLEHSSSMTMAVKEGKKTVVVLLLPIDSKVDDVGTMAKNIHWYLEERE